MMLLESVTSRIRERQLAHCDNHIPLTSAYTHNERQDRNGYQFQR